MTTTLSAMQAGNARLEFCVAIDGYSRLLSNAPQALLQAAWASTDWATKSVIDGIAIELDNSQQLNPWNPLEGGGKCIIRVQPDQNDVFGIDIHRTDDGAETMLAATVDRKAPLFVGYADGFGLTGEAHCGTECFDYGFVSGRHFLPTLGDAVGSNRGKYVAHGVYGSTTTYGAVRFAEHHRVATQSNGVRFAPIVSEQPRTWIGRRVSVWAHVYESTGALNAKSDALCLFIGEITETQDTETGHTTILAEHLLSGMDKCTLVRDQWTAVVDYGLELQAGQRFKFWDTSGTASKTANDLVVVATDASGTNQVNAGRYGHEEFASIFNAWMGGEVAAGRIYGNYTMTSPEDVAGTARTVIHYFSPGATTTPMGFAIQWPVPGWAKPLGYPYDQVYLRTDTCGAGHARPSPYAIQPFSFVGSDNNSGTLRINVESQIGSFHGQNDTLPAGAKALLGAFIDTNQWGLFMLECETPMLLLGTVVGNALRSIRVLTSGFGLDKSGQEALQNAQIPIGSGPPRLRQVFVHEGAMKTIMKMLFYSTGTDGYNHPAYDAFPYGQGLAIPRDALGPTFESSCDAMPGADDVITVVLEKPRTVGDVFSADLIVRSAHLVWREGGFRFVSWSTPSSAIVTTVLDETNKAEPIDTRISHRSASVLDSSWVRNFVKINYNRDIATSIGGGEDVFLAPPLILQDATSIDDMGGKARPVTLDLRNVYNDTDQIGKGVRGLAANFLSWLPWWSRPIWKIRRSIAPTLYEGFGPGDVVAVTDPFVRDPATGRRGITTRPGLVVGQTYRIQTAPAPDRMKFAGEVDVVFLHNDRIFAYGPSAELDETANTGGFTAGYDGNKTLKFKAHEHSESGETADIGAFSNGDRCKLIQIDPDDPATVVSWDVVLNSTPDTSTGQVSIVDALSSPSFDSSKRYRLVYDSFPDVQSGQTIKSFQASAGNATITQTSPPDQYGAQSDTTDITTYDHTRLPELPSNLSFGPNAGASRDTGYDKELALLLENMMDHQTRRSSPAIDGSASSSDLLASETGWQLLSVEELYLGDMLLGGGVNRYLTISPNWSGWALGVAIGVQLRITISGYPPSGAGQQNIQGQTPGYTIKQPSFSNSWSTWTGTEIRRINDTPKSYPLNVFNGHQYVFVIVEGTAFSGYCGLAMCVESERKQLRDTVIVPDGSFFEV